VTLINQSDALPITDAITLGEAQITLDDTEFAALAERTLTNFQATTGFRSDAVEHYYGKVGYDTTGTQELFTFVRQFLALSAAWEQLGHPGILSMPEKADNDGWHGFIIQTRDYQAFADLMGHRVHHATTPSGQGDAVTLTLALLTRIFGPITNPAWADCPDCIIYGWCSSGTN
jgi:hypothetical protein